MNTRIKVTKTQYIRLTELLQKRVIEAQASSVVARQYDRLVNRGLVTGRRIQGGWMRYEWKGSDPK